MAQTIHCDVHGREHSADVLVSQLANGDTMAACFLGYVELARALVADQDVRDAEAMAQAAREAASSPEAAQAEVDATDAEVLTRLAAIQAAGEPDQLGPLAEVEPGPLAGQVTGAADLAADAELETRTAEPPRSPEAEALGVAAVVPRGTSRSRKAHQARQGRQRPRAAQQARLDALAAPGPPSEPSDDPGGADAPA